MVPNQPLDMYCIPHGVLEKLAKKGYTHRIDLPRTEDMSPWIEIKEECDLSGPEINWLMNGIFPSATSVSRLTDLLHEHTQTITDTAALAAKTSQAMKAMNSLIVKTFQPVPVLSGDELQAAETMFKERLIGRYSRQNGEFVKCMILDQFFPEKDISATHIIGLKNPQSFMLVGLNYANDRYDERNGLLVFSDIARKYRQHFIVSPFPIL
jgi:hypothetical protein